jgi:uncharacterized protein (TIGR03083 family)
MTQDAAGPIAPNPPAHDYRALWADQQDRISALARALDDDQWDGPSLCDGWKVRHVMAHMTYGFATPLPTVLAKIAANRGNVARGSYRVSIELGDRLSRQELVELYDRARRSPKGLAKILKARDGYADNVVHELDMRRGVGVAAVLPFADDALRAELDALCQVRTKLFAPARKAEGLALRATDVDWQTGAGPTVAGPAEDLVLALAGRHAGLAALEGDGVGELARRLIA